MGEIKYNGRTYSGLIQANGCFVDTENVIVPKTIFSSSGTFTYTATQDCAVRTSIIGNSSGSGFVRVDNEVIFGTYVSANFTLNNVIVFLKKGQVISVNSKTASGVELSYQVYGIQQGSPITFLSEYASACYDTNEREVGCWIDGKPLYQKTFVYTPSATISTTTAITTLSSDIEVKDIKGVAVNSQNNRVLPLCYSGNNFGTNFATSASNDLQIEIYGDTWGTNYTFLATVLYTKTTDTAGSGKLTPTGFETHHYSTNEQIVGTWIDGKPLYEVTVEADNPTINSYSDNKYIEATYSSSVIDFAKCVSCAVYDSTGSRWYTLPYERMISTENINLQAMRLANGSYIVTAHWKSTNSYNTTKFRYTIQFTKTTD